MTNENEKKDEDSFKLSIDFYKRLWEKLERIRKKIATPQYPEPGSGRTCPARKCYPETVIPCPKNLQLLIETVLWASIRFEEARRHEFSVVYHDFSSYDEASKNNPRQSYPKITASRFKQQKPFTIKNIVKLSPIAANADSRIVVGLDNNNLAILGTSPDANIPLKIKVIDPGDITIGFVLDDSPINKPLVRISAGEEPVFIQHNGHMKDEIWLPLKKKVESKISNWTGATNATVRIVMIILHKMRILSHGGTLILYVGNAKELEKLEQDKEIEIQSSFRENSCLNPTFSVQKSMDKDGDKNICPETGYFSTFEEHLKISNFAEQIALLTTVDGATLVDENINILGFGTKLLSKPKDPKVTKFDSRGHKKPEITSAEESGGTRHQSAIRFISNNKNAIAFVVSQDRTIKAFVQDDKSGDICQYEYLETYLS